MNRTRLSTIIFKWLLIMALVPALVLASFYISTFKERAISQEKYYLSQIADIKVGQIEQYISERLADAHLLAESALIKQALSTLIIAYSEIGLQPEQYQQLQYPINNYLMHFQRRGYHDILLISPEGDIVFSVEHESDYATNIFTGPFKESGLNHVVQQAKLLREVSSSQFDYYLPSQKSASFIASPVLESGQLKGYVVLQIDIEKIHKVALDTDGEIKSRETLIGSKQADGFSYLSPLKFNSKVQWGEIINYDDVTEPLLNAMDGTRLTTIDKDYRGVEVLAVSRYIPSMGWGLVVKEDLAEIMQPVQEMINLGVISLIILSLSVIAIAVYLGRIISKPISSMTEVTKAMAAGDLTQKLVPEGFKEGYELAESFNVMSSHIKKAQETLEERVLRRTEALTESNDNLQKESEARLEAQHELREREKNLEITLNSIGDAVIATDEKGNVTRMNPVAEELTAWSISSAKGLPIDTIFPIIDATSRKTIANPVETVLETGKTVYLSNHTTLISKDGKEHHIADSAAPIRDDNGDIQGMVLVFNDVSEEYQLREEVRQRQQLLQGLMNNLKSMVGVMNIDGRVEFVNRIPLEWAGVEKEQIVGQLLWQCDWFSFNQHQEEIEVLYQQALSGEAVVFDTLLSTSCIHNCINCQSICLELSIYPIFDESGDVIQIIFEGEDILERKKAEDLQKNYQSELESQVEQRTSDLTKKAEELERATKLKSEFLANMSHELRTPMNSIIGFTGRVIKKSADKLDERQLKNLQTVERNAHELLSLINGLLDLSKIEVGKMDVYAESFDFSILIQEVMSLVSPLVNDKDVGLKLELENSDIQLHTDYTKLKQILINLLSNAIKFTESGSITVTAKLQELPSEAETHLVLNVIDTGEGMSDAALAYVFEPFRQVDGASTRKVGGTGLGLAIVRDFCKLLHGSITVSSQLGEGTNVELTIPIKLDIDDEVIFDEQLITPDNTLSKTILCIDDEVEALELLSGYLIEEGHHVVTASSSEHGLALARQIKPFVITLDIMMPHKDGWSILSELKASEELRDIPVIIISFMENKAVGYKLGAFDFMQKPVDPKRLMASIQRVVPEDVNRIMVIDDDHDARELITQILVDTNIVVETAVDGNDALRTLESIKSELPELILLDLMMPDMDGFEFLQKMQDNPLWANIPVIIVTAKTLEEHERDFLQPRVNSILAKQGLAPEELLKQLLDDINVLDTKVSI